MNYIDKLLNNINNIVKFSVANSHSLFRHCGFKLDTIELMELTDVLVGEETVMLVYKFEDTNKLNFFGIETNTFKDWYFNYNSTKRLH